MQVTDVRAVIAIGVSGQFGLRGRLPWEGNRCREYVADVERFFELTRGHVLIMGHRTFTSVPDFAFQNRDIVEIYASDTMMATRRASSQVSRSRTLFGSVIHISERRGEVQVGRLNWRPLCLVAVASRRYSGPLTP